MKVHIDTHKVTGKIKVAGKEFDSYSVEITINNDRREVVCSCIADDNMVIHGLAVRFKTGAKVWPGHATYWVSSDKVNGLAANIGKMGSVRLVGFFSDFQEKTCRSRHNAVA